MGGSFFGNHKKSATYNFSGASTTLNIPDQRAFEYSEFDKGGHCAAAKIYYLTRIEKLKESIKKNKAMSATLMNDIFNLTTDLLSHRHLYTQDWGFFSYGNIWGGVPSLYTNKLSGYPAEINNQVLLQEPYIAGSISERWFSSCTDFLNPEILVATAVLRQHRMKTSEYFNYDSTLSSSDSRPPEGFTNNFGLVMDFNFNFTSSDLGTTKYFYTDHDDSAIIIFNGLEVYNQRLGSRHAFFIPITSDLINKPIPCQITWTQGPGPFKFILRMSDTLGSSMNDYSPIGSQYISSLTPINEWGDAKNVSFYTLIQHIATLFHHTHYYTDAGQSGDQTYADLKNFLNTGSVTMSGYVPISTHTNSSDDPVDPVNTQLTDGSGFVREVSQGGHEYIDITISPFSAHL